MEEEYKVGYKHPPKSTQFGGANANRRNDGCWKKEDTARYKLEQMLKLSESELSAIANDKDAPLFERRIARSLLKENGWRITEGMINQAYGFPKQEIAQTNIELPRPRLAKSEKEKE